MKENSKEKLERQLNENPELKERFNLQMKSITESVKETTAPFEGLADSVKALENLSLPLKNIMNSFKAIKPTTATQSIVESLELFNLRLKPLLDSITSDEHKEMVLLMDKTKIEYTSLRKSEREFIEHERLYIPNDVYEFLDWYLYCYLFDKPIDTRKKEELGLYHFNLFYTFKQRYKKHKKWDIENEREFIKEYEFLNNQSQGSNNESEPIKHKATHYALAYIFDCDAKGRPRLEGRKKELEKIGRERSNNKIDGNTFYKAFNSIQKIDLNIERDLINIIGTNWKKIILDLSEDPDLLDEYLKTKQL
jgi:hypothetical protein